MPSNAARQIEILEDGDVGDTVLRLENTAAREQRLIPVRQPPESDPEPRTELDISLRRRTAAVQKNQAQDSVAATVEILFGHLPHSFLDFLGRFRESITW